MLGNQSEAPESARKLLCYKYAYPLEYLALLKQNPRYRLYFLSHICQHIGDWYIRIASLLAMDRLAPNSATAISILVLVKVGPHALLPSLGGALADSLDRRKVMMALDLTGAFVTLGFMVAIETNSLVFFYIVAALRATVHSLYEPTTKALVPMIVGDHEDLKRAMTLNGLAWAFLMAIGGVVAGDTSSYIGLQACFAFDSLTYFISACVLYFLHGNYKVPNDGQTLAGNNDPSDVVKSKTMRGILLSISRPFVAFTRMTIEVIKYLWRSGFGVVVLLKSTGSIIWGATDVLNMEYAHVPDDEAATSERLGIMFSCLGAGCLVGPVCANFFTDPDRPATLQLVCIGAIAFMMSSWIGYSQAASFSVICFFSFVRGCGSSVIWVNSSLLLQRLSVPEMLGRVLALEFAFMMFFESVIAYATGILVDKGITKHEISTAVAAIAAGFFLVWSTYHLFGRGAARKEFNQPPPEVRVDKVAKVVFA